MGKPVPAETRLNFVLNTKTSTDKGWIDLAESLSFLNRRLYAQGKCYYITDMTISQIVIDQNTYGSFTISTLPDTWVTANAWVKSKALWKEMNQKVLADNPSTEGKWADFKVLFDSDHADDMITGSSATVNLLPADGNYMGGYAVPAYHTGDSEWDYSKFVAPQHNVNTGTGAPLAADEFYIHMLGDDNGSIGSFVSVGAIKGYQDTRAQVQTEPDVPGGMSTSWMTTLTDDGSQEPELADVIESQSDEAPYSMGSYPGAEVYYDEGMEKAVALTSPYNPQVIMGGVKVPLGLLKLQWKSSAPAVLSIGLMPGDYKGVMATEVRQ